jgi:hypothetical protein
MSLRDRLGDSVRASGDSKRKQNIPSKAYHKFFEGYSEVRVPRSNGKGTRIKRIYTGEYYRQDLSPRNRVLIRLLYVVFFLCASLLFVSGAIESYDGNSTWYVNLPEAACVFFLFWILMAFIEYLPAAQDMTISEYRSSSLSLLKATMGAAACLGVTAFATLLFLMVNSYNGLTPGILGIVKYISGGLIMVLMYRLEKKLKYQIIPNTNQVPDDGVVID